MRFRALIPLSLRLAAFADGLLALSMFLKAICSAGEACFSDPFVAVFFEPLFFVERHSFHFTSKEEILFLFWFWFSAAGVIGFACEKLFPGLSAHSHGEEEGN